MCVCLCLLKPLISSTLMALVNLVKLETAITYSFCCNSRLYVYWLYCMTSHQPCRYRHCQHNMLISHPDRVKIWLKYQSTLPPQIFPKWPTPCSFWASDTFDGNGKLSCGRMIRYSAIWENILETIIALSNGTIVDPLRPPLPQNGGPKCTAQDQLRDACCHLANIIV